jgi:superfamily II DNA/RNA helicase
MCHDLTCSFSRLEQFGMPESREQYIHRLGRTGRGGTAGKGWLVLSEWESLFLQELKGVNIPADEDLRQMIAEPISPESQELLDEVRRRVGRGDKILTKSAKGAYQAFLGYYLGQMKRMRMKRKEELVEIANDIALQSGLHEPPSITKQLVGKMGLKGVAGIKLSANSVDAGRDGSGSNNGRRKTPHSGHNDGRRAPKRKLVEGKSAFALEAQP